MFGQTSRVRFSYQAEEKYSNKHGPDMSVF